MSETKIENISFDSSLAGHKIAGYVVTCPEVAPHAILQIAHGMAEYWLRYEPFARYMAQHGFVVCGHDHLGHGETSGHGVDGYFAPQNGELFLVEDIHRMTETIKAQYPGLPLILMGHSMGSFLVRWAAEKWPDAQDAAIFCGTGGANPGAEAGIFLTNVLGALRGQDYKSKLIDKIAFGSYLKHIPAAKTPFDWLSTNEANVQKYIADPKCGFLFSVSAFRALFTSVQHVNTDAWAAAIRRDMPVYVVAGAEDPVGAYGAGPHEVAARLTSAGAKDVTLKLYDGLRHEILNETGNDTVYTDILAWCESSVKVPQAL